MAVEALAAATATRQLYRVRAAGSPGAMLLLSRAAASPAGWADRLRALVAQGQELQGGGLVTFQAVGAVQGVPALLRPWVDGLGSRAFARSKVEGLPPLLVLLALVDAATALETLHAKGIQHGRLAPENAILGRDGRLVLVDIGLGPALSGRPGTETGDIQDLARLGYQWLSGRALDLAIGATPPPDLPLPSRLDRRVPAQADSLILRALQAGGPRGLRQARELVLGLRQVLRSAGAAVSPEDTANWAAKHAGAAAGPDPSIRPLLPVGHPVVWEPLVEKAAIRSFAPALQDDGEPDTVREQPPKATRPATAPPPERIRTVRPVDWLDPKASAEGTGSGSGQSEVSRTSASQVVDRRARRLRRFGGGLLTALLAIGVAFLGLLFMQHKPRRAGVGTEPRSRPQLSALPPAKDPTAAPAPKPPLPAFQPPPLPIYRADAPARPKPVVVEKSWANRHGRTGRGAYLSLQSDRVARIFVDGRDIHELTPLKRFPISPGNHRIRLVAAMGGGGSQEFKIHAQRGREVYRFGSVNE